MRSPERLAKIRLPLIEIKSTFLPLTFGYQSARNDSSEKVSGRSNPFWPTANLHHHEPNDDSIGIANAVFLEEGKVFAARRYGDRNTLSDLLNDGRRRRCLLFMSSSANFAM